MSENKLKELFPNNMWSEALRTLDRNTVQYMIDEQNEKLKEQQALLQEQKEQLDESKKQLDENKKQLDESKKQLDEKDAEIARLKALLADSGK